MRFLYSIPILLILCGCALQREERMPELNKGEFAFVTDRADSLLVQGDSVTVFFRTPGEGTQMLTGWFNREYGRSEEFTIDPLQGDTIISDKLTIPEDAIGLFIYAKGQGTCFSGDLLEDYAEIRKPDGSTTMCGAVMYGLRKDYENFDEHLQRELEHFPDNAMAYTERWFGFVQRGWVDSLRAEMGKVEQMDGTDRLCALAIGHAHLGERDSALSYFNEYMNTDNPRWALTATAALYSVLDYADPDHLDLIIRASETNIDNNYTAHNLAPYFYIENPKPNQRIENVLIENRNRRPYQGYLAVNYYRDVQSNKKKGFEEAKVLLSAFNTEKFTKKGNSMDNLVGDVFSWAGIKSFDMGELELAANFLDAVEKITDEDEIVGEAALTRARIAHKNGEDYDKYIIIALSRGQIDEAQSLHREFTGNSDITALFARAIEHNEKAPDYSFVDSNGDTLRPGNGEIQLLHFWGPGCKPCITEKPNLEQFAEDIQGARLFAITNYPEEFVKEKELVFKGWENIYDKAVFGSFSIMGIPTTIIVDGDGFIRFSKIGAGENYKDEEMVIRLLSMPKETI